MVNLLIFETKKNQKKRQNKQPANQPINQIWIWFWKWTTTTTKNQYQTGKQKKIEYKYHFLDDHNDDHDYGIYNNWIEFVSNMIDPGKIVNIYIERENPFEQIEIIARKKQKKILNRNNRKKN